MSHGTNKPRFEVCRSSRYVREIQGHSDNPAVESCFRSGCDTLFNKDTFEPDLQVKSIDVPAEKVYCN